MPHQTHALAKVLRLRVGALFMEMGTGKSRTAIELVARRAGKIDRVIWFCPVSLKETIAAELDRHLDAPSVCVFDDKTRCGKIPTAFWYIVGIESMSASRRVILSVNSLITAKSMVILDESQYIKTPFALRTKWISRLAETARYRLVMTGTPITQGIQDLYAQMYYLSPKILGYRSFYSFAANHLEYDDGNPPRIVRAHNTEWLAAKIQPYVYQVTKAECLDLPKKLHSERWFSLSDAQERASWEAKQIVIERLHNDEFRAQDIFVLFLWLQQIASGFWRCRTRKEFLEYEFPNPRLALLEDVISQIHEDNKIIIWAKFHFDIQSISAALARRYGESAVSVFYGLQDEKRRNAAVAKFRSEATYFVATPSCGGHGLTLNDAYIAIFYNNSFKYAERLQAEDRCHRIGQTMPVTYIDLYGRKSIDERIAEALGRKSDAAKDMADKVSKVRDKGKLKKIIEEL
jgi:SNF2 family DNA or RNA helicase